MTETHDTRGHHLCPCQGLVVHPGDTLIVGLSKPICGDGSRSTSPAR